MDSALRVVLHASKNPQRLGSLLAVALLASESRSVGSPELAETYSTSLTRRVAVPETARAATENFLRKRNLLRKYAAPLTSVEVQDWLLADEQLPSGTGSERGETRPTVDLARALGLISESNRRTWLGSMLCSLPGVSMAGLRDGERGSSPYRTDAETRLVFLWLLIRRDYDMLCFVSRCLDGAGRSSAVSTPELFERVSSGLPLRIAELQSRATSDEDRAIVRDLSEICDSLSRTPAGRKAVAGGVTVQTMRRKYEDFLYWHLESLVDLGVLAKVDRAQYEYFGTDSAASLEDDSVSTPELAQAHFFRWASAIRGGAQVAVEASDAFDILRDANRLRANSMGYSLIEEAVLAANILLMRAGDAAFIEERTIRALITDPPHGAKIVTSVDRKRRLSAFKVIS